MSRDQQDLPLEDKLHKYLQDVINAEALEEVLDAGLCVVGWVRVDWTIKWDLHVSDVVLDKDVAFVRQRNLV